MFVWLATCISSILLLPRRFLHTCGVCPCMNPDSPCSWIPQNLQVIVPAPRFPIDISHIPQMCHQRGWLRRVSGRLRLALRYDNLNFLLLLRPFLSLFLGAVTPDPDFVIGTSVPWDYIPSWLLSFLNLEVALQKDFNWTCQSFRLFRL